jgi:hypothetical protein
MCLLETPQGERLSRTSLLKAAWACTTASPLSCSLVGSHTARDAPVLRCLGRGLHPGRYHDESIDKVGFTHHPQHGVSPIELLLGKPGRIRSHYVAVSVLRNITSHIYATQFIPSSDGLALYKGLCWYQ